MKNFKTSIDEVTKDSIESSMHCIEKKQYTTNELSELFQVHYTTVKYWRDTGILPYLKIGGSYRYTDKDLKTFLKNSSND